MAQPAGERERHPDATSTCALCPRLCRPSCPVATGTAREAAVPAVIAGALREWQAGRLPDAVAAEAATLCTDCGACRGHCHLDRPLPEILRAARDALADVLGRGEPEPLAAIEGDGEWIAVEADDRPLAAAVAQAVGRPVARWRTGDRLGSPVLENMRGRDAFLAAIRAAAGGRGIVLVDGGVADVLRAAGVPFTWLQDLVPGLTAGDGSCAAGGARPLACCGAAGPLARHHPDDALRVAAAWLDRSDSWEVADARCRCHLRAAGGADVVDPLDQLLARA